MIRCRKWKKLIVEALYNELNQKERNMFENHLNKCPACTKIWQEMKSSLSLMNQRFRTEPDDIFWNGYWDKLADKINSEPNSERSGSGWKNRAASLLPFPAWAVGTVAALGLVIIGIFIGRIVQPGSEIGKHSDYQLTALEQRTDQYLESSKLMMLGFANFDADNEDIYTLNLPLQKQKSDLLVKEAGYLKNALKDNARNRLFHLVSDLEVILLQIANLESEQDITVVEIVKSGVEKRSILFKINLEGMKRISMQKTTLSRKTDKRTT